jgi:hypothetical protein
MNFRIGALLPLFAVTTFVFADDSAITWGGNPQMLQGHPTVQMVSEKVVVTVHPGENFYTDVDCNFVFHNDGAACDVRIGFPDRASGMPEGNFTKGGDVDFPHPTFQALQSFKSWVDGKPIGTTVVPSHDPGKGAKFGGSWHVKVVHFGENQTLKVRDTYRQPQSGGSIGSGYLNQVQYILSTGGSWNGNIESAEVDVIIPGLSGFKPASELGADPYTFDHWADVKPGHVYYSGYAEPVIEGNMLVFKRANFKPDDSSDINVFWPQKGAG